MKLFKLLEICFSMVKGLENYDFPTFFLDFLAEKKITSLNPAQKKSVKAGLLEGNHILACTPTGSGKTAIALLAMVKQLVENRGKVVYLVPLRALASEKFKDMEKLFSKSKYSVGMSTGDLDSTSKYLDRHDVLILTIEKMDSLLRHHCNWIKDVRCIVIDEIHLLNDVSRGPTLEILITLLKQINSKMQLVGLSATIGNPKELAEWLGAELVIDTWRPVKLHKGIYFEGEVEFV